MVDVGGAGRQSDGGVLSNSLFGRALENGSLRLPDNRSLPGRVPCSSLPYVFVGDEAFPLKQNVMRPYPGRNLPQAQATVYTIIDLIVPKESLKTPSEF